MLELGATSCRLDTQKQSEEAGNGVCPSCGYTADSGSFFCKQCASALRPAEPLISNQEAAPSAGRAEVSGKVVATVFLLGAVVDFVFGYMRSRSLVSGAFAVFFGLFGTGLFVWVMWLRNSKDGPDESKGWGSFFG